VCPLVFKSNDVEAQQRRGLIAPTVCRRVVGNFTFGKGVHSFTLIMGRPHHLPVYAFQEAYQLFYQARASSQDSTFRLLLLPEPHRHVGGVDAQRNKSVPRVTTE
jgi:hypothetical protein